MVSEPVTHDEIRTGIRVELKKNMYFGELSSIYDPRESYMLKYVFPCEPLDSLAPKETALADFEIAQTGNRLVLVLQNLLDQILVTFRSKV